mgnify:FL=1
MGIFIVPEFKNMKFRVKDEEHSKQIQEYLFSLRYHWDDQARGVDYTDAPFLFTTRRGYISQTYNSGYVENNEYPEYRLKETKSYSLEEVKPIKSIATLSVGLNVEVTVNGEKISLKDLKELLNKD